MEIKFSKRRRREGDRDGARGESGKEMVREGWRSGSAEPEKRAPPDPRTAPRLCAARRGPRAPRVPPSARPRRPSAPPPSPVSPPPRPPRLPGPLRLRAGRRLPPGAAALAPHRPDPPRGAADPGAAGPVGGRAPHGQQSGGQRRQKRKKERKCVTGWEGGGECKTRQEMRLKKNAKG